MALKISSDDARLAHDGCDIPDVSVLREVSPQMVICNVHGHVIFILQVLMYYVCVLTDLIVRMLPFNFSTASLLPSMMSYTALLLFLSALALCSSSMTPLLTPTNFLVFASVANRETVLVATASSIEGTVKSSLPEMNSR